jgi:hypothetical protein
MATEDGDEQNTFSPKLLELISDFGITFVITPGDPNWILVDHIAGNQHPVAWF